MSEKLGKWPSKKYSYSLPMRYTLWGPKDKGVVVALHGYQDHALSMMSRIGWWEKSLPFQVLAVNAPFPVPIWTKNGFLEAYSWYFRDTDRGFTIVSPTEAALRVYQLIQELGLDGTPIMIFGFSQGGYLAPFVGHFLKNLRGLICLGSGFPPEPYTLLSPTTVLAIHGDQDERIPYQSSQAAHALLMQKGFKGEFRIVPGLTHRVDPLVEPMIRDFAVERLR